MLARLRRHSWLAALLLALSPALAGTVLPLLHPCPVDAPWMAAASETAHGAMPGMPGMAMPEHGAPAPHAAHECSCVECCAVPPLVVPPAPAIAVAEVVEPATVAWPVVEGRASARPILEHLPESTAPPLA